jgi:hypothetical protein
MPTLRSSHFRVFSAATLACVLALPAYAGKNDAVPPEQLVGKWKDAKGAIVNISQNEKGDFTLTRKDVGWEQVGAYKPGNYSTLTFKYKPSANEMPDDIPGEIKGQALDTPGFEWRIKFPDIETGYRALGHGCKLFMKGEFLPGDIKWRKVTEDGSTTNTFESAKIGGPPKPIEVKQVTYFLPDMGDWLQINTNIDATGQAAGLGQIASIPMEAQAYTYLGNLDAAILEGMYKGLTAAVPLEGVGGYGVKILKSMAKGKLEGKSTGQAGLETAGKLFGGEILKGMLPKDRLSEFMQGVADKVRDKVAEKVGKKGAEPLNEALFQGEEDKKMKSYLTDVCRFQFVQLPNYNPGTLSVAMAVVDTKLGNAHFIFVSPPRDLKSGGHFQGAILTGDISLPEDGEKPKPTQLNLSTEYIPAD